MSMQCSKINKLIYLLKNRLVFTWVKTKFKNSRYYENLKQEDYEKELKEWFHYTTGEKLSLDNPKTYNEKIQWLKLYDTTPLKTQLSDKYRVREWVKEKTQTQPSLRF